MWYTFKFFFRSLWQKKTMSMITIGGYAISMAVFLILITFIIGEKNVNKGFKNRENLYRIVRSENESTVPKTLYNDVKEKLPGVDKMCLYTIRKQLYKKGDHQEWASFIATTDDFLDMFSFDFIFQSSDPTLFVKENIILTKEFSERLFSERNPVGEYLEINNNRYTVVGVVNDVPENSSFRFDAFMNVDLAYIHKYNHMGEEEHTLVNSFVMLNPNSNPVEVNIQLSGMISHWEAYKDAKLSLQPLKDIYFNGLSSDQIQHANINLIYLLSSIAIIILLMTVFNYVNLTVSRGYERLNEIGIKKTAGAGKTDIFRQVLTESYFVSLLAMIIALVIISIISPLFTDILGKRIELSSLFSHPLIMVAAILIFFATGILSGIYPALAFSGVSPLQMMAHNKGFKRKGQRAGIIAVQFFVTSVLIISLLIFQKQLGYVKHMDPGFDKEMLVRFNLMGNASQKWEVLRNEILKNPRIISVSASSGSPLQITGWTKGQYDVGSEEKEISIESFSIDEKFVETFGLTLVKGRNIQDADSNVCLINEHLYKNFEWDELTGKELNGNRVVGVVKDFHFKNLYNEIGNLELRQVPKQYASVLNVKINGNILENIEIIRNEYKKVEPEIPFDFRFYDDWLQSMYQKEEKQAKAIRVFSFFAIIISCLGLIGLIEHITNKKVKEIGIRKINGAKINEIIAMLNKKVVLWVTVGFVIACPIAWYAMHKWLENFAYKTELSWWIFALAGLLALGIALLTVSWQSWRAATRNPVEALRYE